jgi:hypothetical protein
MVLAELRPLQRDVATTVTRASSCEMSTGAVSRRIEVFPPWAQPARSLKQTAALVASRESGGKGRRCHNKIRRPPYLSRHFPPLDVVAASRGITPLRMRSRTSSGDGAATAPTAFSPGLAHPTHRHTLSYKEL